MLLFSIFAPFMRFKINWDALGISASLACAIHCALLPLFMTSLPLFGTNIIHNKWFEASMILLAVVIGGYSLYHGYKRHHHSFQPLLLFFLGMGFLILKMLIHRYELLLLIPAVFFIIAGHINNYRFCRVHNHAHSDDCNH
jgi:hypothetical protein